MKYVDTVRIETSSLSRGVSARRVILVLDDGEQVEVHATVVSVHYSVDDRAIVRLDVVAAPEIIEEGT